MKKSTLNIANKMTAQINHDVEVLGLDLLTPSWFYTMIECIIEVEGITFENDQAETFFTHAVVKQIDKKAYNLIFPPIGMDENGEYTSDSTKWA
tara:strand:+ start:1243 stop:1524 length:282 start_codon:yes stop_codon:yes gene_type:complete